ncbi:serpin family protein [Streptomyces sp. NPDC026673]|uniref:serpin family protein n=1 Tax=Streptomyces sp. NPDC026673 TaxID=3155724 RepID=UPI0033C03C58
MDDRTLVRAVNGLTARWAREAMGGSRTGATVFSAAGVWPLLALLAAGAAGPARAELEQAVGTDAATAAGASGPLLARLDGMDGIDTAVGLWTRATLPLVPGWLSLLPAGAHGRFTGDAAVDRKTLDAWAADRTDGMIPRMPVAVDRDTLLLLANALALRTDWAEPFRDHHTGRLFRSTPHLDMAGVAGTPFGPLTMAKVNGTSGLEVHLLLGPDHVAPGEVIAAGVGALDGAYQVLPGNLLPYGRPGPGVTVEDVTSFSPAPALDLTTVPFTIDAEHDLLEHDALFGLRTARNSGAGHFPGISGPQPLAVGAAKQSATATFSATGFRAAAVTAISMIAGSAPGQAHQARRVRVEFLRPFGFLAVHRRFPVVLVAGWVTP